MNSCPHTHLLVKNEGWWLLRFWDWLMSIYKLTFNVVQITNQTSHYQPTSIKLIPNETRVFVIKQGKRFSHHDLWGGGGFSFIEEVLVHNCFIKNPSDRRTEGYVPTISLKELTLKFPTSVLPQDPTSLTSQSAWRDIFFTVTNLSPTQSWLSFLPCCYVVRCDVLWGTCNARTTYMSWNDVNRLWFYFYKKTPWWSLNGQKNPRCLCDKKKVLFAFSLE